MNSQNAAKMKSGFNELPMTILYRVMIKESVCNEMESNRRRNPIFFRRRSVISGFQIVGDEKRLRSPPAEVEIARDAVSKWRERDATG